jgi:hypothetical protein
MATTLTNLQDLTLAYVNEPTGTFANTTYLNPMINAAYHDIAEWLLQIDNSFLVTSTTISRTSGTMAYSMTGFTLTFLSALRVEDTNHSTIPEIDGSKYSTYDNGWWIWANSIYFWPDTVTETDTLYYNYFPVELSGATDAILLPDYFKQAIALGAAMKLKALDEEEVGFGLVGNLYERELTKITNVLGARSSHGIHSTVDMYRSVR